MERIFHYLTCIRWIIFARWVGGSHFRIKQPSRSSPLKRNLRRRRSRHMVTDRLYIHGHSLTAGAARLGIRTPIERFHESDRPAFDICT